MTNDEEYEKAEGIRKYGKASWDECEAIAKEANAEIRRARVQAENDAIRVARQAEIADLRARIDAIEAKEAKMKSQEEVHTKEPTKPIPIVIPSSPPPFYVKAIPDDLVQDSLVFKCGVLAKWYNEEEMTNTNTPPPHNECEEGINLFVHGGEGAKGGHYEKKERSTKEESPTMGSSTSFGRALAKSLRRCCPMGTREDEWIEEFGVHSGRFKLLASPLY